MRGFLQWYIIQRNARISHFKIWHIHIVFNNAIMPYTIKYSSEEFKFQVT